jgi:hypothetical protein
VRTIPVGRGNNENGDETDDDEGDETDGDDDDKGCMHEASVVSQIAVRQVMDRMDFIVGVACLAIALWLRVRTDAGRASQANAVI